jgi:DNA-binding MarR family transcriptional regulator
MLPRMDAPDAMDHCVADMLSRYPQIDPEVEGVVDRMAAVQKHLSRIFEETLVARGLNHGEYKLMLRLATRSEEHRISAGELSRMLMLSSGAMTNRLDRLEKAGLVRRVADPRDRRGVLVELTPKGVRLIDDTVTTQAGYEADSLSVLSAKERTQLNGLLRKVLVSLEARPHPESRKAAAG